MISMVIRQCLEPAIFLEEYPKTGIYVYIDIIQADAGTRTAAINAASVALADAGIPMRDLVTSVAAGKIGKDYYLDIEYKEEEETFADIPIAYMPRTKQVSLLQMDGDLTVKEVKAALQTAIKGCEEIYDMQKAALKERWDVRAVKLPAKATVKKAGATAKKTAKPAAKKPAPGCARRMRGAAAARRWAPFVHWYSSSLLSTMPGFSAWPLCCLAMRCGPSCTLRNEPTPCPVPWS